MDNHSSGICVTTYLKRPTRIPHGPCVIVLRQSGFLFGLAPSGVFPATPVASRAVRSYRTISPLPTCLSARGGIFSVALSVGFRLPGVTWHSALWSPDFPPFDFSKSDCLTDFDNNDNKLFCEKPAISIISINQLTTCTNKFIIKITF